MTQRSQFGDIQPGEVEAMAKDNVRRMTDKAESQTDEQITERAMFRWASEKSPLHQIILDACRQSRAEGVDAERRRIAMLLHDDPADCEMAYLHFRGTGATNDTD